MSRSRPSYFRAVLLLVGAALVITLVVRIGPHAIYEQLACLGAEVSWMMVPYGVGTTVGAFPWAWLLPAGARPSRRGIIASRFAASGANALLPFFGVAGEPSRLLWLAPQARPAGLAAVVLDRVLYNVANGLFLLTGAAVAFAATDLPALIAATAAAVAVVIVVATLGIGWAVAHFGVGDRLRRILARLLGSAYAERGFGGEVDEALRARLRGPLRLLWRCLATHYVSRALLGLEVYVALRLLHAPIGWAGALVLGTVPVATSLVASSIPSQLGVQEAAMAFVCTALGLDPATGLAVVLLQRLRQVLFAPLTPMLLAAARSASGSQLAGPEPPAAAGSSTSTL